MQGRCKIGKKIVDKEVSVVYKRCIIDLLEIKGYAQNEYLFDGDPDKEI